jgi:hypothetical protein
MSDIAVCSSIVCWRMIGSRASTACASRRTGAATDVAAPDVVFTSRLVRPIYRCASGTQMKFASDEAGAHRVVEALQSVSRPTLATLLPAGATFIDLGLGVDLGYSDYIVVASTDPIERRLSPILEAAEQAIVEYESRISQFTSPTDALSLMEALAGP